MRLTDITLTAISNCEASSLSSFADRTLGKHRTTSPGLSAVKRARWDVQQARKHAREALVIADRCEYRLVQTDLHNLLARVALEKGDREEARKHAEVAKERAWCDGPPHCYKPALEAAERILESCGGE